ncbi:hypothetical protein LIA77_12008 [Sarocladium implicatum]|nr:hypothetical protein LIA77_12008 [Sarocladium implicatum]
MHMITPAIVKLNEFEGGNSIRPPASALGLISSPVNGGYSITLGSYVGGALCAGVNGFRLDVVALLVDVVATDEVTDSEIVRWDVLRVLWTVYVDCGASGRQESCLVHQRYRSHSNDTSIGTILIINLITIVIPGSDGSRLLAVSASSVMVSCPSLLEPPQRKCNAVRGVKRAS